MVWRKRGLVRLLAAALVMVGCTGAPQEEAVAPPVLPAAPVADAPPARSVALRQPPGDTDAYWTQARLDALEAGKRDFVVRRRRLARLQRAATSQAVDGVATVPVDIDVPAAASPPPEPGTPSPAQSPRPAPDAKEMTHILRGTVTVEDLIGPIAALLTGSPDTPWSDFDETQLAKARRLTVGLTGGNVYPCVRGTGANAANVIPGAQLLIADGNGTQIATAVLQGGVLSAYGCTFHFTVTVPDRGLYIVTMGDRSVPPHSRRRLERKEWRIDLVIPADDVRPAQS